MFTVQIRKGVRQIGWAVCFCPSCKQNEASRFYEMIEFVSIFFIPYQCNIVGQCGHCDFCEQPVENWLSEETIPLSAWSPRDGYSSLTTQLGLPINSPNHNPTSDPRLHSLLLSTVAASSVNSITVTWGFILGVIFGAVGGIPLGKTLFRAGVMFDGMSESGSMLAVGLIGGLLGGILGSLIEIPFARNRIARRKIEIACENYNVDLGRLQQLAQSYPPIVRRAVNRLRDLKSLARA